MKTLNELPKYITGSDISDNDLLLLENLSIGTNAITAKDLRDYIILGDNGEVIDNFFKQKEKALNHGDNPNRNGNHYSNGYFYYDIKDIKDIRDNYTDYPGYFLAKQVINDIPNLVLCTKRLLSPNEGQGYVLDQYLCPTPKSGEGIAVNDIGTISISLTEWEIEKEYSVGNLVHRENQLYMCSIAHTSSDWQTDFLNGCWTLLGGGESGGFVKYVNNHYYPEDSLVIYNSNLYKRKTGGRDLHWIPENWILLTNGEVATIFIKYSHTMPTSDNDMIDEPAEYMGISIGDYATAPAQYTSYTWYKIKGDDVSINLEAESMVINYTLPAESWEYINGYYTQTITADNFTEDVDKNTINLITEESRPIVDIELPSNDKSNWENLLANYNKLIIVETGNKSITFSCLEAPEINFTVKIRVNGDLDERNVVSIQQFEDYKMQVTQNFTSLSAQFNELKNSIVELNEDLEDTLGGN